MEIRSLKYLVSLADSGSFTAAAREHFVTQPAVSIQLRKLQEELGGRLFEVKGREIRFTEEGNTVLEYARRYIDLEGQLMRELGDLQGLRKGRLSLGTIDAASIYVLPGIFSRFHELYPGIEVGLEISSTLPLLKGLKSGRLDLVVGSLHSGGLSSADLFPGEELDDVEIFPVYRERLVAITPPGHPLAGRGGIRPAMLGEYPFISFQKESVTRKIVEKALADKGVSLRVTMEIDSQEAIRNLVASGLGLSILPEWTVSEYIKSGRVAGLEIKGLEMERRLGLMVPVGRYLSSTARAFLAVMREGLGIKLPDRLCVPERGPK